MNKKKLTLLLLLGVLGAGLVTAVTTYVYSVAAPEHEHAGCCPASETAGGSATNEPAHDHHSAASGTHAH